MKQTHLFAPVQVRRVELQLWRGRAELYHPDILRKRKKKKKKKPVNKREEEARTCF